MKRVSFSSFLCCSQKELEIMDHMLVIEPLQNYQWTDYGHQGHEFDCLQFGSEASLFGRQEANLMLSMHWQKVSQINNFYNHWWWCRITTITEGDKRTNEWTNEQRKDRMNEWMWRCLWLPLSVHIWSQSPTHPGMKCEIKLEILDHNTGD